MPPTEDETITGPELVDPVEPPEPVDPAEPETQKEKVINYYNGEKLYNKEYIDKLLAKKQDIYVPPEPVDPDDPDSPQPPENGFDTVVTKESTNAVQNRAIAEAIEDAVKEERDRADEQESLLDERVRDLEEKSGSLLLNAVKVGETMFWPQSETTTRIVGSDAAVMFSFDGKLIAVEPEQNVEVKMCVAKDVPEGWAPCDGTARFKCEDYPELAKFFRGTRNEDGTWNCDGNNVADKWHSGKSADARIWIPYCAQRIIKIHY